MFLLDDLLALPVTGFKAVLRTLARVAEEQYTDDAPLKQQLLELQMQLDSGELSEEEYAEEEARILMDLRDVQNRKREMAGLPPEPSQGLTGNVAEGSGAYIDWGDAPTPAPPPVAKPKRKARKR